MLWELIDLPATACNGATVHLAEHGMGTASIYDSKCANSYHGAVEAFMSFSGLQNKRANWDACWKTLCLQA